MKEFKVANELHIWREAPPANEIGSLLLRKSTIDVSLAKAVKKSDPKFMGGFYWDVLPDRFDIKARTTGLLLAESNVICDSVLPIRLSISLSGIECAEQEEPLYKLYHNDCTKYLHFLYRPYSPFAVLESIVEHRRIGSSGRYEPVAKTSFRIPDEHDNYEGVNTTEREVFEQFARGMKPVLCTEL